MAHAAALLVVELVLTVELVELLLAIELILATELRIELDVVVAEELDAMDVVALELELGIGVSLGVLFTPPPPPPQPLNRIVRLADSNREDNFIFSVLFVMGELWASNFSLLNDWPAFYGFFAQDCSRAIDRPWC